MDTYEHPFSWPAIGRLIATGLILLIVWKIFNIIVLVLIAAMLAAALYPFVKKLNTKLPLSISALMVIFLLLVPFIILAITVIPGVIRQFPALLKTLTGIVHNLPVVPSSVRNVDLTQYAQNAGQYVLQSTSVLTNAFTSILTLVVLTFYFIFDAKELKATFLSLFPKNKQTKIAILISDLGRVNGQYIRGNLTISVICGLTIFIGLTILNIPFAAPLAIFTAIMDLLPLIGAPIAMVPAIIIGLAISPLTVLLIVILYVIYQQIENAFLAPMIYNKALNISPAFGFLALMIGAGLFGIIGAFLALPFAASLPAIIKFVNEDLYTQEKRIEAKYKNK